MIMALLQLSLLALNKEKNSLHALNVAKQKQKKSLHSDMIMVIGQPHLKQLARLPEPKREHVLVAVTLKLDLFLHLDTIMYLLKLFHVRVQQKAKIFISVYAVTLSTRRSLLQDTQMPMMMVFVIFAVNLMLVYLILFL